MAEFTAVLADDVPELCFMTKLALESTGRIEIVGTAENGREAVDLVEAHKPDLVLLDISMPEQDGFEAIPEILNISPRTKVVMLSGYESSRLGPLAMELGAIGYIEKGASAQKMVSTVLEVLRIPEGQEQSAPPSDTETQRDELLAMINHEFRQPLAVISGFGLTLAERWDALSDAEKRRIVERMTANAAYLVAVLSNVIQLRGGERAELRLDDHDAAQLIGAITEEVRSISHHNPLELDLKPGLGQIRLDEHRLRQVVTNLIVNAAKFSPADVPITIRADPHPDGVKLSVIDQGPGIPPEEREQVFDKFVKGDPKSKGLGLGLYISRSIMDAMGGSIWIEDTPSGTTISCLLPRAAPA